MMSLPVMAGQVVLSAVFGVAGAAKLLDPVGSRAALVGFGVPGRWSVPVAIALPAGEIAIALALLVPSWAWYGAAGALGLCLVFVVAIAINLAHGRTPDCHCFGQLYSRPADRGTLVRNGLLALVAAGLLAATWSAPGGDAFVWFRAFSAFERVVTLVLSLGVAALGVLIALLVDVRRQVRAVLERPASGAEPGGIPAASGDMAGARSLVAGPTPAGSGPSAPAGLPIGSTAPEFDLADLDGQSMTVASLLALGRPLVLHFSDPACGPCTRFLPDVAGWQRAHHGRFTLAVVSRGTPEANRAKGEESGVQRVLLQRDREVAEAYRVMGTPSAVLIREDGTVGSVLAQGEIEIGQFIERLVAPDDSPSRAPDIALDFALPDLDGRVVRLSDFRGAATVILFWNPTCGHCQRMLDDLRAWEARPPAGAPHLLIVSAGTAGDNRAQGFRAPVLLDDTFRTGSHYGAAGTPAAVLVDADGRLASAVVAGAPAVLALLGTPAPAVGTGVVPAAAAAVDAAVEAEAPVEVFPADAFPMRKSCVQDELLADGGLVLYDSCRRQVMTLNATAALVWDCCDGTNGVDAIAGEVIDMFQDQPDVGADVRAMLNRLYTARMIEPLELPAVPVLVPEAPIT